MSNTLSTYTVGSLINQTLKVAGVLGDGQTASGGDLADAVQQLNQMLAVWQRKRWLVNGTITTGIVSNGSISYTVGPGGDIDIPRPDRIESAFVRFLRGASPVTVDIPLALINAREDYNEITVKNLSTFPSGVFYDNGTPFGDAYFWPIPPAGAYELFITVMSKLQNFSSASQIITMPPEYIDVMQWSLAARLRAMYAMPPDETITALALSGLTVLRNSNAQVGSLDMPGNVPGVGGNSYNVYSDQG